MTDAPRQPDDSRPGGYGYPPSGYGYPQADPRQPAVPPAWTPPSHGLAGGPDAQRNEPDWSALAEQTEADRRRRRLLLIGGGALGAAAVAAAVTAAVVTASHAGPGPAPTASATSAPPLPTPSFSHVVPPPPPDPLAMLSDGRRDTAPLTAAGLFPGTQLIMQGRQYAKGAVDATADCSSVAAGGLAPVLTGNGCRTMLRASYTRGGVAVTVGVAVFADKAAADRAKQQFQQGYVLPLPGAGIPDFCRGVACQTTMNSVGRYAYFTIAGLTGGTPVTAGNTEVRQAAGDIAAFAADSIVQRGRDEAATAAATG